MKIDVYSDGSATVASKPGGYGWVICIDGVKRTEGSGHMESASNNDAELEAAIQGLAQVLKMRSEGQFPIEAHEVTLVSDSEIILGWANGTYRFKQYKKIVKYHQLMFLVQKLNVQTRWVEGHTGDEHNERCDELANLARKMTVDNTSVEIKDLTIKKAGKVTLKQLQSEIEALKSEIAELKRSVEALKR